MADRKRFSVSVVTPDGPAFEGEVEMIIVPGAAGEIGVLARHAPLIATLKAGSTRVHPGDGVVREFATGPGFFQVKQADGTTALTRDGTFGLDASGNIVTSTGNKIEPPIQVPKGTQPADISISGSGSGFGLFGVIGVTGTISMAVPLSS